MSEGKRLLVLGASSDMGLALIRRVYNDYDRIVAHYNSSPNPLAQMRGELGDKLVPVQADFSDPISADGFTARVEELCGCPSHIVHLPASKVRYKRFTQGDWADVERDLRIQLGSIYSVAARFIKPMAALGGASIVFVLTSNTVSAPKYMAEYTTVKYALLGLMKSLAVEYADKGVRVNAVSPSMIETKFLSELPEAAVRQAAAMNPAKRNAVTSDIVPAIRFLLSEDAGYITGQNIIISGGAVI